MARIKRSREDWAELVAEWRASGLTSANFAEERGLSVNSLRSWSSRLGREPGEALNAAFVAVEVRARGARRATDRPAATLEVGQASLRIDASACPRWVAELLRELGSC